MKTVLTLIYYLGLLSCSIQGVRKATDKCVCTQSCFVSAFLSSFAGGLIRDIIILHVYPAVFTTDCFLDITVVFATAFIYMRFIHKKVQVKPYIIFTDSIGMGQFITIGVDKALLFKKSYTFAVISGVCTCLGGGIVSSIFNGVPVKQIALSNLSYKFFSVSGVVLYTFFLKSGADPIDAQTGMIIYTLCVLPVCGNTKSLKKLCVCLLHTTQTRSECMNLYCINTIVCMHFSGKQCYFNSIRITNIPKHLKVYNKKQRIYLYHRIRQM